MGIQQDKLTAQEIPAEVENAPTSAPKDEADKPEKTKLPKDEKKAANAEKIKPIVKEAKKETKPPSEEKLLNKKPVAINKEKPKGDAKNKSSTLKVKLKT